MTAFRFLIITDAAATALLYRYTDWLSKAYLILAAFGVLAFQILAWFIYRCILYPKFLSPLRSIPGPLGGNILMGHRLMMMREPNGDGQSIRGWQEQILNDGILRYLDLFNSETLVPISPKALAEVLVHKTYDFIKPPQLVSGLGRILGVGVFLAEGEEHKRQRKILNPAFAFRHIKELYPVFWNKSSELVRALIMHNESIGPACEQSSAPVDVNEWASRATLDIIGVAGLGQDFNSIKDPNSELIRTYKKIFSPSPRARMIGLLSFFLPTWLMRSLPIQRNDDIEAASKVIKRTCLSLVQQAKQKMAKKTEITTDILSVAIESGGFSDDDLVNQLMTFLIAGHETTASGLSWAICMLCRHPNIQSRLRDEVRSALPDPRSPTATVSASDIDNLPYLNAVCNEVLRLYPGVPITVRVAIKDTSLLGQFIPKGTSFFISPWATNANKELWGNDAADFNPDRWIGPGKANTGGADSNYSFLTFLQGPRSCIGQTFAKGEFACLLAAWVGAFKTRFAREDYEISVRNGLTPRPKDLEVKLKILEEW